MTPRAIVACALFAALGSACRSKPAPTGAVASAKPVASSSASAVSSSKLSVVEAPPVASVDLASAPGPLPAGSAERGVRETAVLALLRDPGLVRRAPLVDLEPGRKFDWELRDRISPPLPVPAPKVRMVETTIDGDLSDPIARRIIRQNYGRFRMCYERGLDKNPKLEGKVKVALSVAPNGSVRNVRDGGSKLSDPTVTRCIVDAMAGLSFPSTRDGVNIVQTIELVPPG